MMEVRLATLNDTETIISLAHQIWPVAYLNVVSQAQIAFMLAQIYNSEAIRQQQSQGHQFFILQKSNTAIGFASLSLVAAQQFKLEKLYVHHNNQGQGGGKLLVTAIEKHSVQLGGQSLVLNVNRNNKAVHFYQKLGFNMINSVDIPYHQYMLNDYIMGKSLTQANT